MPLEIWSRTPESESKHEMRRAFRQDCVEDQVRCALMDAFAIAEGIDDPYDVDRVTRIINGIYIYALGQGLNLEQIDGIVSDMQNAHIHEGEGVSGNMQVSMDKEGNIGGYINIWETSSGSEIERFSIVELEKIIKFILHK